MSELRFEWEPEKAAANIRKHRVSFEETKSVFKNEEAIQFLDPGINLDLRDCAERQAPTPARATQEAERS